MTYESRRQPTTYAIGEKLIFTAPDGTEGECQVLFKGLVPGCLVVTFLNREGRPTSHDGLTLPISRMRRGALCPTCAAHRPGELMPPHRASDRCQSGKRPHCTCDICF